MSNWLIERANYWFQAGFEADRQLLDAQIGDAERQVLSEFGNLLREYGVFVSISNGCFEFKFVENNYEESICFRLPWLHGGLENYWLSILTSFDEWVKDIKNSNGEVSDSLLSVYVEAKMKHDVVAKSPQRVHSFLYQLTEFTDKYGFRVYHVSNSIEMHFWIHNEEKIELSITFPTKMLRFDGWSILRLVSQRNNSGELDNTGGEIYKNPGEMTVDELAIYYWGFNYGIMRKMTSLPERGIDFSAQIAALLIKYPLKPGPRHLKNLREISNIIPYDREKSKQIWESAMILEISGLTSIPTRHVRLSMNENQARRNCLELIRRA